MAALPAHDHPDHTAPDSQRLLRAHGAWPTEWDEKAIQEPGEPAGFAEQVEFAIQSYAASLSPLETRWALIRQYGRQCRIGRVLRAAEAALLADEQIDPVLRRALVGAARRKAIQGAMQDRAWGPAGAMLARAGEVAGELSEEAGLTAEDLVLVVEVEEPGEPLPLPASETAKTDETGETDETARLRRTETAHRPSAFQADGGTVNEY